MREDLSGSEAGLGIVRSAYESQRFFLRVVAPVAAGVIAVSSAEEFEGVAAPELLLQILLAL